MARRARASGSSFPRDKSYLSLKYIIYNILYMKFKNPLLSSSLVVTAFRPVNARMASTLNQNIGGLFGYCHNEGIARSGSPFRASGSSLEPENEGVYLRGRQRHIHHRFAENPADVQRGDEVPPEH